jgi:DNA-binding IclR family transcriptional regulator
MANSVQTRRGQPVYEENPSVAGVAEHKRVRMRPTGDVVHAMHVDPGTGEIKGRGAAQFVEEEEVDGERFVKLYLAGLRQQVGLSRPAVAVFELVVLQLQDKKNSDTVHLAAAASDMSASAFSRGLRELVDRGFLYRSPYPSLYWVNVRYIFNGDRLEFIKSYRRRREPRASRASTAQKALPFDMPASPAEAA